ncbi:CD1247 N-terminal domain-containing protein [Brevibacillus borstelensis]|uniref:CD1247 N-terminal domain-containing protein n=1 Tax=Brevibacillus borstelensis TaxID=45462 RepID=UPI0030BD8A5E
MLESLANRISYLRGLADGMDLTQNSSEGKVLSEVIEVLDEMYGQFRELHARIEETEDYVEAIDDDLDDVELYLFGDEDDLYEIVDDCEDDENIALYDEFADQDDEDASVYELDTDDNVIASYEIECPSCHEILFFQEGEDDEGYHHYIIEPYPQDKGYEPINAT